MLKKGDWRERGPVTDECHDRLGKLGKRSDEKLGQNSSKRQSSDAQQLGCAFQDMTPPKSLLRKGTNMPNPIQRVKFTKATLHVIPKFETKILRSDIFAQVNITAASTPHNLRIGLRRRQNGKSKVPAKQRGSWPKVWLKERTAFFSLWKIGAWPASTLTPEERKNLLSTPEPQCTWSAKRTWVMLKWILWRSRVVLRQS